MKKSGIDKFIDKYGVDFSNLVEIPKVSYPYAMYKENYRILYDKLTDRYFSLWQTPYQSFILIEDQGFITQDDEIREEYYRTISG
jgi:hypothetical protein